MKKIKRKRKEKEEKKEKKRKIKQPGKKCDDQERMWKIRNKNENQELYETKIHNQEIKRKYRLTTKEKRK